MRKLLSSFLLFLSILPIEAQDNPLPINQKGYIKGEFIYAIENRLTPQCHASTIAETGTGLIAAWFGGTEEKAPDVGIWVSKQIDGNWGKPAEAANGIQPDGKRLPCWNPVLFKPSNGPLMLFYKIGPDPQHWWGMVITSEDDGASWSAPKRLPDGFLGPIKNKAVELKDGLILAPSSDESDGWKVHFEATADLGATWQKIGPINDGKDFSAIQPSILIHSNSALQMLCRSMSGKILQSWSMNGGKSWTPLSETNLPNPNSGTDAVTLADGRHLLVYNRCGMIEGKWRGERTPLNAAVSSDGINWKNVIVLENDPGEYSYPAVIQTKDGLVHITYTFNRDTIKHVIIDPAYF